MDIAGPPSPPAHGLLPPWERLAAVVEMATDAVIVIDEGGRIVLFNASAERLFGCSGQHAIGTDLGRFIPPYLHARYRAGMDRWRRADPQVRDLGPRSIWWGLRTTGEKRPCEVSIAQCRVGGTRELMISVRDITEQRQSTKAVRRRAAFERFLFDLSSTFIAIPEENIDANMTQGLARVGTFLEMDRVTLLELSGDGTTMTSAYSWSASDVMPPLAVLTKDTQQWWLERVLRGDVTLASRLDDLPEEAAAAKAYLRQRGVRSAASIPLEVNGAIAGAISFIKTQREVSWTAEKVNQLRVIGDILWNALKRLQAMEALRAAREIASESEERLRLIANTAPVMIWMADVDGQLTYVNQTWLDFTGLEPGTARGHGWTSVLHPDDLERIRKGYLRTSTRHMPFQHDHRLRRHDGEYRWIASAGVPRFATDGSLAGYVGTAVDVHHLKQIEVALLESHAALQERTVELERRTTQLSQLASDLTLAEQHAREDLAQTLHDGLQQQLTVVAIKIEGHIMREAKRGAPPDELVQAKESLDEAIAAARSLSVELFPPVLHSSGLPTALDWLAHWSRSNYGLDVVLSADPLADSDRKDLRTLLFGSVRELLFNVVKHAHVDRVTVDLALGANDTLCITVADEGVGFDTRELNERSKANQVGWGLFSIRERLTLLGGRFDVESTPGRGTRFRLIAPRDIVHRPVGARSPSRPAAAALSTRAAAGAALPRALRIVIADDHPALRKIFRELLQARPEFQIVGEAINGLEAITQAQLLRPDVVLMDVSMPEMDGVEATRRIHAELPSIKILGFSIHERGRLHPIEAAGAEAFFVKGVDTQRLIDHLLVMRASRLSGDPGQSPLLSPKI